MAMIAWTILVIVIVVALAMTDNDYHENGQWGACS